jgi:hypothetical protein
MLINLEKLYRYIHRYIYGIKLEKKDSNVF